MDKWSDGDKDALKEFMRKEIGEKLLDAIIKMRQAELENALSIPTQRTIGEDNDRLAIQSLNRAGGIDTVIQFMESFKD